MQVHDPTPVRSFPRMNVTRKKRQIIPTSI
jgi:hypothetical protein